MLDDETELQAEQRALQALTGEAPAPAEPAAPSRDDGGATPPPLAPSEPRAPAADDEDILPGDDHRDPVEW